LFGERHVTQGEVLGLFRADVDQLYPRYAPLDGPAGPIARSTSRPGAGRHIGEDVQFLSPMGSRFHQVGRPFAGRGQRLAAAAEFQVGDSPAGDRRVGFENPLGGRRVDNGDLTIFGERRDQVRREIAGSVEPRLSLAHVTHPRRRVEHEHGRNRPFFAAEQSEQLRTRPG
jgi:hypothetical protein